MANAKKRKARKLRRTVDRGERVKPTPETARKLRPHPLEQLLALGREGGGIDADQLQCAGEIVDAAQAVTAGLGIASVDVAYIGRTPYDDSMSPHAERLQAIWFQWALVLQQRLAMRPFAVVELIANPGPLDAMRLSRALDLWAKVRRDHDRPPREVSTFRPIAH